MLYSNVKSISNKSFELIVNSKEKDFNSRVNDLAIIIIEQNTKIYLGITFTFLILDVACGINDINTSSLSMPDPSSITFIKSIPPFLR